MPNVANRPLIFLFNVQVFDKRFFVGTGNLLYLYEDRVASRLSVTKFGALVTAMSRKISLSIFIFNEFCSRVRSQDGSESERSVQRIINAAYEGR